MTAPAVRVGMFPPADLLDWDPATARAFLARASQAGIDHVCCGDHVSFLSGLGFDRLMQAAALALLEPTLGIYCACTSCPCAIRSWSPASSPTLRGSPPGAWFSASGSGARIATKSRSAGLTRRPGACG